MSIIRKNLFKIKQNLSQIFAITEKNIMLSLRFKLNLILSFITPLINIILPLIILGRIFTFSGDFGPWNSSNFVVFQLVAYQIILLYGFVFRFPGDLRTEKIFKTLQALVIAPFKRINLLFGIYFSHIFIIFIPFIFFFILCYLYYPISLITIFYVILIFFLISVFFAGLGLVFGAFILAKESLTTVLHMGLSIVIVFSCITMPFEFFPGYFQNITRLNPLYYIFNLVRLVWIDNNILFTINVNLDSFIIVIACAIIFPVFGIYFFNYIYKKYGIAGY